MTCIVGIATSDWVIIGGDAAAATSSVVRTRSNPKVFRNGPYAIGYTSSFRIGQLIQYGSIPSPPSEPRRSGNASRNPRRFDSFMATTFVDAIRKILSDGGALYTESGTESGGQFLVGIDEVLYTVYSDFQVARAADGFDSVGSGEEFALGSLHSTAAAEPEARVLRALAAAAHFSGSVRAPFTVLSTAPQPEVAP